MVWIVTWMLHYVQRAFVYPIVSQSGLKVMPLAIVFGGFSFNCVNAYLNASFLYSYAPPYPETWWFDLRFISGMCLFAFGYVMNRHSDRILRSLRRQSPTQYGIPEGGFFQWVSCPNYLGEILIWCGWALATWALPALAFAVWTTANLAPRAGFHHRWYKSTFSDYPANRKALIPGIW
jgi:steroid 5-alpha reductase family enzyme